MSMPYLQQARIARGLSLEDLADAIGSVVSRQTLRNYEAGETHPNAATLKLLATVLKVSTADLLRGPDFHCEHIAYRKKARLSKKEAAKIEACVIQEVNRRCWVQSRCLPGQRIEPVRGRFKSPTADNLESETTKLRKEWGLGISPIRNLVDELESHSIHVITLPTHEDFDGLSSVVLDSQGQPYAYSIAVKRETSMERQRFNMAHELGHILYDSTDESAAHAFAGAFMAPEEELKKILGDKRNRIKKEEWLALKQYFGMSMQALIRRAKDCGIIQEDSYRFWNTVLHRKKEDGDTPECEASTWILRTVMRGYAEGVFSKTKAEELLGKPMQGESLELKTRQDIRQMSPDERRKLMAKQAVLAVGDYSSPEFNESAEPGEVLDDYA